MVSREEFDRYVSTLITEEDTKTITKSKRNSIIISSLFLIGALICAMLVVASPRTNMMFIVFAIICAIGAIVTLVARGASGYKTLEKKYKKQVIDFILKGEVYEYNPHAFMPRSIFNEAQLGRHYDSYKGEDFIKINIPSDDGSQSVSCISLSDVYVTDTYTDNEGKEHTRIVYKGVLGCVRFPFNFKCRLTINRNSYAFLEGLDKVDLESIEFNKQFDIRTNDQIEARYILTTDMMARLLELEKRAKNIGMVFDGNSMYITMPNKNLFTLKSSKQLDGSCFTFFYEDLATIMSIIKEIKENDKVFKI